MKAEVGLREIENPVDILFVVIIFEPSQYGIVAVYFCFIIIKTLRNYGREQYYFSTGNYS